MYEQISLTFQSLYAPSPTSFTLTARIFDRLSRTLRFLGLGRTQRSINTSPSECSGSPSGVSPQQLTTILAKLQERFPEPKINWDALCEGNVLVDGKWKTLRLKPLPDWIRFPAADGYDPDPTDPVYGELLNDRRDFEC